MFLAFVIGGAIALIRLLYTVLTDNQNESQANPVESRRRRQLDGLETYLYNTEKTGTSTIGNILCLTSSIPLTSELITKSLLTLVHRQPHLRAKFTVLDRGLKKYLELVEISDIAVPLTSVPLSADHWKRAWEERRYVHTFKENGLQWSASVLREEFDADSGTYRNTLIFALHHAICDGMSSAEFTKQFVEALNQVAGTAGENSTHGFSEARSRTSEHQPAISEHRPTISDRRPTNSKYRSTTSKNRSTIPEYRPTTLEYQPTTSEYPFVLSMTSLLHHKVGYSVWQKAFGLPQLLGALAKLVIRLQAKWRKPNPLIAAYIRASAKDCSPVDNVQTIVTKELSVGKTKDLVTMARSHDTTVNSILTVVSHVVLWEILQGGVPLASSPPPIPMIVSVNIRKKCCPPPPDEYIAQYAVVHKIQPSSFVKGENGDILKLAKDFNTEFKKQLNSEKHLLVPRVFDAIGGDAFCKMAETSPTREINAQVMSNLGRHEVIQSGTPHFQVSNLFFLVSMRPTPHLDTTLFCNMVLTINGKLQWVTCYDHTLVGRRQAEEFVSKIFEKIDSFL